MTGMKLDLNKASGPQRLPPMKELREDLRDRSEALFRAYWGEPARPGASDWRAKDDTARHMKMRGADRGAWADHKSGAKGGPLEFFAIYAMGWDGVPSDIDGRRTLRAEVTRWLDIDLSAPVSEADLSRRSAERAQKEARRAAEAAEHEEAEKFQRAAVVRAVRAAAQPVEGTPAEGYLRSRGIDRWPTEAVAYVAPKVLQYQKGILGGKHGALVVWGLNDAGEIVAGQRVLIDSEGRRVLARDEDGNIKLDKNGLPEKAAKPSFAAIGGAPARLPARNGSTDLIVAEGPETALSIWMVTGCETWAVFGAGQFKDAPLPLDRRVILAPDQDALDSPAGKAFDAAVALHSATHPDLWIARAPAPVGSKSDLNDTLLRAGPEAVRVACAAAVKCSSRAPVIAAPVAPTRPLESLPDMLDVGIARARLRSEVRDGLRRKGVTLIEATLGLGKTHATITELDRLLHEAEEAGIAEPAAVIAVPMHKLGRQVTDDVRKAVPGRTVVQLYGAEALDPDNPTETVCKRLDEYRELASLLLETDTLCGACTFATTCLHLASKAEKADIYIASHERLKASRAPLKAGQKLVATVVDENPIAALVTIRHPAPLAAIMAAPFTIRSTEGQQKRTEAEADLRAYRARLQQTILAHGAGDLRLAELSGWTASDAKTAAKLEWKRKVEDETNPDVKGNRTLPIIAGIYAEIARSLDDQIEVNARLHIRMGEMGLECILRGLKSIGKDYRKAPILMLDATADAEIAGKLAGEDIAHHAMIRARENLLIEQDPQVTGAKSYFFRDGKPTGNVVRVRRFIEMQAQTSETAAISNKEIIAAMDLTDHILTAHFNALRGLNDFAQAETMVVLGRTLPPADALSNMVAAIYGTPCVGTIHPDGRVWRLVTSEGVVVQAETKTATHEDPRAERLLRIIRDAEVEQAVGRLRAVNRSVPVRCILLSDAVVNYPVKLVDMRATIWACGVVGAMLERGGVAFLSPAHASVAYPDLYASKQAAAKVFNQLSDTATFSIEGLYGKGCPVVSLKRPRAKEAGLALVSPSVVDIEAKIKALIPDAHIINIERPDADPARNVIPLFRDGIFDLNLAMTGGNLDKSSFLQASAAQIAQLVNLQQFRSVSEDEAAGRKAMLQRRAKALRSSRCEKLAEAKEHLAVMGEVAGLALVLRHRAA